jgi:hypothetical protein
MNHIKAFIGCTLNPGIAQGGRGCLFSYIKYK